VKGLLLLAFLTVLSAGIPGSGKEKSPDEGSSDKEEIYPGVHWTHRKPEEVGLDRKKLDRLSALVGGNGCVVRHGSLAYEWGEDSKSEDVASAVKPVISALLLFAVQEGRLKSPDDRVAESEPRLRTLNGGKDAGITWRHLASQTSGYGLTERPGEAYAYNDYALALYYDTLTEKVFRAPGTEVLKKRLGDPLQFEDPYTFKAFGLDDRSGRLAISTRDFARFGLWILRGGVWNGKALLRKDLVRRMIDSPIPADTPLSAGRDAPMLPGQRTLGGGKNQTPVGPGFYSFNWWRNGLDRKGRRLFTDAPPDAVVASGHGGIRTLWIVPSLDLTMAWNDADVTDHDASPGHPETKANRAIGLLCEAVTDRPSKPRRSLQR
jgi:CubicO group peptidase (beta-lactamase class C family)